MPDETTSTEAWVPAFEGQRPPLPPGHELTLQHGAYSPRKVQPLAGAIVEAVLTDESVPTWAKAAAYRLELWAMARAEAQVQLVSEWLEANTKGDTGLPDLADDRVRAAYHVLHRAEGRAASGRSRLGLNPAAAAKLGKTLAQGQVAQADVALRMAGLRDREQAIERARAQLEAEGWRPPAAEDQEVGS